MALKIPNAPTRATKIDNPIIRLSSPFVHAKENPVKKIPHSKTTLDSAATSRLKGVMVSPSKPRITTGQVCVPADVHCDARWLCSAMAVCVQVLAPYRFVPRAASLQLLPALIRGTALVQHPV